MGLSRHLGAAARSAGFRKGSVAVGAAGTFAMGARRRRSRIGAEKARRLPPRRHRAENALPVPAAARRGRRADSAAARREALRRRWLKAERAESLFAGGRRLSPLSGRQCNYRHPLYVGLGRRRAEGLAFTS